MSFRCSTICYKFAWPPFCTAHSLSRKTQAHLPFTVCVWPQRYKHREWSDTVHMQLHYEYFKSDSIRVTLMSKCKIMFILHFVSLHSKDTWLLLFSFLLKFEVYKFSVLQVAATEFYHLFSFKGKSSQNSDQDNGPNFSLMGKFFNQILLIWVIIFSDSGIFYI